MQPAGSANIEILTNDNTSKGFNSAIQNFKNFGSSCKTLEDNLLPLQSLLKGGMFAGGAMTGIGMLINNYNKLGTASQGLSGIFSEITRIFSNSGTHASILGKKINNLNKDIAENGSKTKEICAKQGEAETKTETFGQKLMQLGTKTLATTATIYSLIKSISGITDGIKTASKAFTNCKNWYQSFQELTQAFTLAESAGAFLESMHIQQASAAEKNAARILLVSNNIAGLVVRKRIKAAIIKIVTLETYKNILAKTKDITITKALAAWETISAACKNKLSIATMWQSTKNAICTATTIALGVASKICAAGFLMLDVALKSVGIGWITVAITGLIAGITYLCSWLLSSRKKTDEQKVSNKELAESALNAADAIHKCREAMSESGSTDDKKLERLEQLKNKQNKTAQEMEEARKLVSQLSKEYKGLGIAIDGTTISIDENVKSQMKNAQSTKQLAALEVELANLNKALNIGGLDEEQKKDTLKRKKQVLIEIDYYKSGGIEDVTGKSEKDILQMKIDAENKLQEEKIKHQEKVKEAEEKRQAFAEKGLKLQADMEKTIRQETMSALEKELEAVDDITKARREELELARKKGEITEESYNKEIAALNKLEEQRKDQIKAKYKKEADSFYTSFEEKIKKEKQDKAEKEEEKSLNQAIETNPFEALKTIQGKLTTANSAYNKADRQWQEAVKAAKSDGVITKEEKEQTAKLEQARAEAMARVERMQGLKDNAQGKIRESVDRALEKARKSQEVNPVDTLMKGSVEAYKKELENANRGRTVDPTVVKLDELKKQMAAEAKEKADREKRTSDYVKKICESVGAV